MNPREPIVDTLQSMMSPYNPWLSLQLQEEQELEQEEEGLREPVMVCHTRKIKRKRRQKRKLSLYSILSFLVCYVCSVIPHVSFRDCVCVSWEKKEKGEHEDRETWRHDKKMMAQKKEERDRVTRSDEDEVDRLGLQIKFIVKAQETIGTPCHPYKHTRSSMVTVIVGVS